MESIYTLMEVGLKGNGKTDNKMELDICLIKMEKQKGKENGLKVNI